MHTLLPPAAPAPAHNLMLGPLHLLCLHVWPQELENIIQCNTGIVSEILEVIGKDVILQESQNLSRYPPTLFDRYIYKSQ